MERIKLEIEGLPELVYVGRTYQYRIVVRNHESRSVTVLLKSHQTHRTQRLTIPASGSKNVEVRGKFESAGSQAVTYTVMKSGNILDSISQFLEVESPPAGVKMPKSTSRSTTQGELENVGSQTPTYAVMKGGNVPDSASQLAKTPLAEAKRPESASRHETRAALLVLFIVALAILIPVFWPQISGFFTGETSGTYGDYYLGLVIESGAVIDDGYGNLIVLVNSRNAQNPTYSQLLDFLLSDKTDLYPYQEIQTVPPPRHGNPENYVDLQYWKEIIDGTVQPDPPRVCTDYAERLHNNAEMAGIRCAFVSVALNGPTYNHALNAFETSDRGLIYIDDSGTDGSHNVDKVVDVEIGKSYVPQSLFPTSGWGSTWQNSGTVNDIFITWDGVWNK
jgi:hypothetical protein